MSIERLPVASDETFDSAEEPNLLAWRVLHLSTLVRRAASQRFRRMFDLSMLEWLIVVHLAGEAPLSLTALARNASIDFQRASLAVSRLGKRELVSRRKNPDNAREAQLALTPRGRAVFNAIIENWLEKELFVGFTEGERAAAAQLLLRLGSRADQILQRELKGVM